MRNSGMRFPLSFCVTTWSKNIRGSGGSYAEKMTGGRKPPREEKSFDTIPPRNTRSLRLLFPTYSDSFYYFPVCYQYTLPLHTPAREIGGII